MLTGVIKNNRLTFEGPRRWHIKSRPSPDLRCNSTDTQLNRFLYTCTKTGTVLYALRGLEHEYLALFCSEEMWGSKVSHSRSTFFEPVDVTRRPWAMIQAFRKCYKDSPICYLKCWSFSGWDCVGTCVPRGDKRCEESHRSWSEWTHSCSLALPHVPHHCTWHAACDVAELLNETCLSGSLSFHPIVLKEIHNSKSNLVCLLCMPGTVVRNVVVDGANDSERLWVHLLVDEPRALICAILPSP